MVALGNRLSALKLARAREPGLCADGNGLYLQAHPRMRGRGSSAPTAMANPTKWVSDL